jgi:hypothetical protein
MDAKKGQVFSLGSGKWTYYALVLPNFNLQLAHRNIEKEVVPKLYNVG